MRTSFGLVRVAGAAALTVVIAACSVPEWADSPGQAVRPGADPPNIVFVVLDALRADRVGVYGHEGGLSPELDAIAAKGVVVERAVAQAPWTQPSVASMFTSLYPGVHGVVDYATAYNSFSEDAVKVRVFDGSLVTLPEMLQSAGYETAAFVANPFLLADFGFAQGFDHFDASFAMTTTPGDLVNEAALEWLDEREPDRPFFLFMFYMDVHGPYDARPEFLEPMLREVEADSEKQLLSRSGQARLGYLARLPSEYSDRGRHERLGVYREYWVARYEAGVREVDHHLGALRAALQERGAWEDALVVVTADHGEALFEHGHWDHGTSLHHQELHVPLVMKWAGVIPGGARLGGNFQLIDLMPTLMEQLSIESPEQFQGVSRSDEITAGRAQTGGSAYSESVKGSQGKRALYSDGLKLIVDPAVGGAQLYDLAADPMEQYDLSDRLVAVTRRMERMLEDQAEINQRLGREAEPGEVSLSEEQLQRLEALGYGDQ